MDVSEGESVSAYEFLGKLFLEPADQHVFELVVTPGFWDGLFGAMTNVNLRQGLSDMEQACAALAALGADEGRKALATEFTSYFVGPEVQMIPPWESLYQGDCHHLFGPPAEQVRGFMRSVGLRNERLGQYPEDHLGYELLVLAYLEGRGCADSKTRDRIAEFVRVHPLALSRTMQHKAREYDDLGSGFYIALLEIAEGVMEEDVKELVA